MTDAICKSKKAGIIMARITVWYNDLTDEIKEKLLKVD